MSMTVETMDLLTTGMMTYDGYTVMNRVHELASRDAVVFLGRLMERKKSIEEIKSIAYVLRDMIFDEECEEQIYEIVEYEMDFEGVAFDNFVIALQDENIAGVYEAYFVGVLLYLVNILDIRLCHFTFEDDSNFYFTHADDETKMMVEECTAPEDSKADVDIGEMLRKAFNDYEREE